MRRGQSSVRGIHFYARPHGRVAACIFINDSGIVIKVAQLGSIREHVVDFTVDFGLAALSEADGVNRKHRVLQQLLPVVLQYLLLLLAQLLFPSRSFEYAIDLSAQELLNLFFLPLALLLELDLEAVVEPVLDAVFQLQPMGLELCSLQLALQWQLHHESVVSAFEL